MAVSLPSGGTLKYESIQFVDKQVEAAVRKLWKEEQERGKPVRLTWANPEEAWKAIGRHNQKPIGKDGFDAHLPAMYYEDRFMLQNCRVFLSNGTEITLEQVPNLPPVDKRGLMHSCAICEYRKEGPCTWREIVSRGLERMKAQAAEHDPNLCRYCFRVSHDNPEDMAVHLFTEHPVEFGAKVGIQASAPPSADGGSSSSGGSSPVAAGSAPTPAPLATPPEKLGWVATPTMPVTTAPIAPPTEARQPREQEKKEPGKTYLCMACGKSLATENGLKIHRTKLHPTQSA